MLDDPSKIVQVNALDGIVRLAKQHAHFADLADAAPSRAAPSPHFLGARAGSEVYPLTRPACSVTRTHSGQDRQLVLPSARV